jgi:LacI family transcriptional regulator
MAAGMEASQRVGMKEIAQKAGVSIATVSMTLADYPHVNEVTKQRIREICRQVGYKRARHRSQPVSNRMEVRGVLSRIGFLLLGGRRQEQSSLLQDIALACSRADVRMEVLCVELAEEVVAAQPRLCEFAASMDGVILSGHVHRELLDELEERKIPHVLYGTAEGPGGTMPGRHGRQVSINIRDMAEQATSILLKDGHQRIGFLCGMLFKGLFNEHWLHGHRSALLKAGIQPESSLIHVAESSAGIGESAAKAFSAFPQPPTAYSIPSIDSGFEFINAMKKRGVEIPFKSVILGGSLEMIQRYGLQECHWIETYFPQVAALLLGQLGELYREPAVLPAQMVIPAICH